MDQIYQPSCDEYCYVIIADETPYRRLADWRDEVTADLYLVSLKTGERTLLFKDFRQRPCGVRMGNMPCCIMPRKRYGIS